MPFKNIKKGAILIARPSLSTDIFNRSVILLTEHSEKGSVGFILNKPIEVSTTQFYNELQTSNQFIYNGGPVGNNNLFFIHKRPDIIQNSLHIKNNIYWVGDFNDVKKAINDKLITPNEIKFYIGYCGWSEMQLEKELNTKEWELIIDYSFDLFNFWDNNLWVDLMKKKGGENLIWLNTPADPSMN